MILKQNVESYEENFIDTDSNFFKSDEEFFTKAYDKKKKLKASFHGKSPRKFLKKSFFKLQKFTCSIMPSTFLKIPS